MSAVERLGLVDEGLAHDITSLFLHLKPENREAFCEVVDMVAGLCWPILEIRKTSRR